VTKEIAKGFTCRTCATFHRFDVYVYAHTTVTLKHTCDCGALHQVRNLQAYQTKAGKKPKRGKQT
jgi:hypothetical protein